MRMSELQRKDIININNGIKIGKIIDAIINEEGLIESLIIERNKYFKSLFSLEGEVYIKYEQIKKLGKDVILVDIS